MNDEAISYFRSYFSAWVVAPYSLSITYFSRFINNSWVICNSRIVLGPKEFEVEESWKVEGQYTRAGSVKLNIKTLDLAKNILDSALEGKINVEDVSLELPNLIEGLSYYSSTTENTPVYFSQSIRITPKNFQSVGISHYESMSIDEELRCGSPTFDGVNDLFSFLGFTENSSHIQPYIELIISPPVDIDMGKSGIADGKLKLSLIKHNQLNANNLSVGIKLFPHPFVNRRMQLSLDSVNWNKDTSHEFGELVIDVTDTVMAQVLLSANGKTVRRHLIYDSTRAVNPRYQAYRYLDSEKKLRDALESTKNSNDFEKAISIIFHLLGFSVCGFLDPNAPDIILYSPQGKILLVECTLQTHDVRTKAGKLHHRREELQEKIRTEFPWIEVAAVLVCNQEKNKITEDDFVEKNRIILYCREDIFSALDYLSSPNDPDEVVNSALKKFTSSSIEKLLTPK